MKRVTGIGGVFFKVKGYQKKAALYKKQPGIDFAGKKYI